MAYVAAIAQAVGAGAEGDAAIAASSVNSQNLAFNADLAKQGAAEDERKFRSAFRRDQARNLTGIAKSGIRLEGSPLEALRENTRIAEEDITNIRLGGLTQQQSLAGQARAERLRGRSVSNTVGFGAAASIINNLGAAVAGGGGSAGGGG